MINHFDVIVLGTGNAGMAAAGVARAAGQELRAAVAAAGRARMRPIVLTTLTTIGGLLPLSLFGGALWAPMTNGMIFGLIVSTGLTLFVIPSLYVLMVEKAGMKVVAYQEK